MTSGARIANRVAAIVLALSLAAIWWAGDVAAAEPSASPAAPVRIALSGAGPIGIDIADGIAWVVGSDSGDVEGVDLAAGTSSQLIPVGSVPTHVVADETGVAVSRIDPAGILGPLVLIRPGWREIASVATGPLGGIAEGEPGTVWALTKAGEVLLVDTAAGEVVGRVAVDVDDAEHMEPVSGAGSLWVASDSLPVQRVTGPDLAVSATIETGGGIPLVFADGLVWGARPDAVWAIDPSVDQVTRTIPLEGLMEIMAMDVADGEAWIAARRPGYVGTVLQVDLATGDVLAEYPVSLPAGVRIADDRAWVTSYETNELLGFPR